MQPISLPRDLVGELATIEWFSSVGRDDMSIERSLAIPARRVPSIATARESISAPEWEAVTADAAGRLTSWLHSRCKAEYQQWNDLVRQVKVALDAEVLPKARAFAATSGIGDILVDCVAWDVLNGVMELTYARCRPPAFFAHLLDVYKVGHLPCGWEGEWPVGKLLFV